MSNPVRLCFVSILAEPGTYDPSIYDDMNGGDNECVWFENTFGHLPGVSIHGYRVAEGDAVPAVTDGDLFILGGSYNSVHDGFAWQKTIYRWLNTLRASGKPLLAICGGHQMVSYMQGAVVDRLPEGFIAGTEPVMLSEAGQASPLFSGIAPTARFHFGNQEHVIAVPVGARLLATHQQAPVAAVDYGEGWFSTQFHPEATAEIFKAHWRHTTPERMKNYAEPSDGVRLIKNFIGMAMVEESATP